MALKFTLAASQRAMKPGERCEFDPLPAGADSPEEYVVMARTTSSGTLLLYADGVQFALQSCAPNTATVTRMPAMGSSFSVVFVNDAVPGELELRHGLQG